MTDKLLFPEKQQILTAIKNTDTLFPVHRIFLCG